MQRIPEELVCDFLAYLGDADLRNVAGVDRRLYRAAQDAGCLILRTVNLYKPETLSTFQEIVNYTSGKDPRDRPGLGLRLYAYCSEATRSEVEPSFQLALNAMKASIPLLVHLEAYVPSFFAVDLNEALRSPSAPLLRILSIGQACHGQSSTVAIPGDLFANMAPRLRTVSLALPNLEAQRQPVSVFRNARVARLALYRTNDPIRVAPLLPQVQSLVVDLTHNNPQPDTLPELDLSGMNLTRLTIDGRWELEELECTISGVDITRIPVFECGCGTAFTYRLWESTAPSSEPIYARIMYANFIQPGHHRECSIRLESAGCTRTAFGNARYDSLLDGVHNIGTRLTMAMLDSVGVLSHFLDMQTPLIALTELYIDLAGHCMLPQGPVSVNFPALKVVTMFAGETPFSERIYVPHPDDVAAFGQMLGLGVQSAEASSAILRMVGVRFTQPMPWKPLEIVFPVVEFHEELDLQGLLLAKPRDSHVERPVIVPDFVVRDWDV